MDDECRAPEQGIPDAERCDEAALFKALGDERRLRMLEAIAANPGICACHLLKKFEMSQSTLSHHVKLLSEARLVAGDRQGKWTHYSIDETGFEKALSYLSKMAESR